MASQRSTPTLPVRRMRPPAKSPRWARCIYRDRNDASRLLCPCCRMVFGAAEVAAASWHVVHGHPLPVGQELDSSSMTADELQVLLDSGLFPELEDRS